VKVMLLNCHYCYC